MKTRARIAVIVLVGAAGGAYWLLRERPAVDIGLAASGTVEATQADLAFLSPGRLTDVVAREGDHVEPGDELARLDRAELEARLAAATATREAAVARLRELEVGSREEDVLQAEAAHSSTLEQLANASRTRDRTARLLEGGAVSQESLDNAETSFRIAEASERQAAQRLELVRNGPRVETVAAQRALVAQADASMTQIGVQLGNATITAPFSGIVSVRHREPGEVIGAGAPVVTIQNLDDRWVRIYVREDQIGRVRIGQEAEITADSYPDRVYRGSVFYIGSEAEFTPRNVQTPEERIKLVYPVKVRVTEDPGLDLKPGIPADVLLVEADLTTVG